MMTPKEKAIELFDKIYEYAIFDEAAKQCALITVDEVMQKTLWDKSEQRFWKEVKQELKNK